MNKDTRAHFSYITSSSIISEQRPFSCSLLSSQLNFPFQGPCELSLLRASCSYYFLQYLLRGWFAILPGYSALWIRRSILLVLPRTVMGWRAGRLPKVLRRKGPWWAKACSGPIYRLGVGRWAFRGGYSTVRWITHPSINICVNLLISQLISFLTHLLIFSLTY